MTTETIPVNGVTRCACGCKYWTAEGRCIDCNDVPEPHHFGCGCLECDPYEGP